MKNFLLAFFLLALASCNESAIDTSLDEIIIEKQLTQLEADDTSETNNSAAWDNPLGCTINNPLNPYDATGVAHNDIMYEVDLVVENETPWDEVYSVLDNTLEGYYPEFMSNTTSEEFQQEIANAFMTDHLDDYFNSLDLSDAELGLIYELFDLIETYTGDNAYDVIALIKNKENEIINSNSDLSHVEIVLRASSVARYSLSYWDEVIDPVQIGGSESRLFGRKFWKTLFVAASDVAGAIGGFAQGNAVGGPWVGAAGAVAGAVISSTGAGRTFETVSPDRTN